MAMYAYSWRRTKQMRQLRTCVLDARFNLVLPNVPNSVGIPKNADLIHFSFYR
jgi:hypothetical protein